MSLQRLAHRIAIVAALRGRTLAGQAVRDSAIPPIDVMAGDERRPFIAVYTDDGGRALRGLVPGSSGGSLAIVIEIGVAAQMENDDEWVVPLTDAGMEITLDVIERQVMIALADEESAWAEMWRRLHSGDPEIKSVRGASAENGVRFAGRQITLEVSPLAEPPYGPPASPLWRDFLDLVAADDDFGPLEPTIRALIESSPAPQEWRAAMRSLLLTQAEADALDVTPIEGTDGEVVIQPVSPVDAQPATP